MSNQDQARATAPANAGGTATQTGAQAQESQSGFNGNEGEQLATELRQTTRRDEWMTFNVVMLGVGAGWSAQQIGGFYGINPTLCANAITAYREGRLAAVRSLNLKW